LFYLRGKFLLHIIHVAGTCMISVGFDGLSRGNVSEEIMVGCNSLEYIPLHLDLITWSPLLLRWIHSWWGSEAIEL